MEFARCHRVCLLLSAPFGRDALFAPGLLIKGTNKDGCKKRKISSSFLLGEDLLQAPCLIRVEGHSALERAELEEGQESFNIDIPGDDVRDDVVTESPEYKSAAAALVQTNNVCQSGTSEAQHKVQPAQFFVKENVGMSTSVVRGCLEEVLSQVIGTDGLDVYAMVNGKIVDLRSTLWSCGIIDGCTVHIHHRLRGGSREDVPQQWTCSQCFLRHAVGQCVKGATRVVRQGRICLSLPKGRRKGMGKVILQLGHWVESRHRLRETFRPRLVNRKSCLLEVRLPETPPSPPSEELVKALQLFQSVLTPEDFSKYEKILVPPKQQERVKLREREILEAVGEA